MREYLIYKATAPSGKVYIGVTCRTLKQRIGGHLSAMRKTPAGRSYFRDALRKYGASFVWEVLEAGIQGSLAAQAAERKYISLYLATDRSKGYNLTPGGHVLPESAHRKLSEIGFSITALTRLRMSLAAKARGVSVVQLENLQKGWNPSSEEQRRRGSGASRFQGHKHSVETRQKMSVSHRGQMHTEEHKQKLQEANWHPLRRSDGTLFGSALEAARVMRVGKDSVARAVRSSRTCLGYTFERITVPEFLAQKEAK